MNKPTDIVDFIYRDGMIAANVTREWAEFQRDFTAEGRGGHIREKKAAQ